MWTSLPPLLLLLLVSACTARVVAPGCELKSESATTLSCGDQAKGRAVDLTIEGK